MIYFKDFNPGMPHIENEYARFWMDRDILFFAYKLNTFIDLKAAKMIVSDRLKFQNEQSFPIFCDIHGIKDVHKTARDYLAREGSTHTKAVSIVVTPSISQAILEFYIRLSKPGIPTKVFTDKHKAVRFLAPFTLP